MNKWMYLESVCRKIRPHSRGCRMPAKNRPENVHVNEACDRGNPSMLSNVEGSAVNWSLGLCPLWLHQCLGRWSYCFSARQSSAYPSAWLDLAGEWRVTWREHLCVCASECVCVHMRKWAHAIWSMAQVGTRMHFGALRSFSRLYTRIAAWQALTSVQLHPDTSTG